MIQYEMVACDQQNTFLKFQNRLFVLNNLALQIKNIDCQTISFTVDLNSILKSFVNNDLLFLILSTLSLRVNNVAGFICGEKKKTCRKEKV